MTFKMNPTIKDFELTFEGQGMPYIYERFLYAYYLPAKSVSIIKNGVVQEFMHKDTLEEMNQEGLRLTPKKVQDLIEQMDLTVQKNKKEMEEILKEPLTKESLQRAFRNVGEVTRAYYFFDPHFFDGIFATSLHDPQAAEVVRLVQEYKNVAREYFNHVHFGETGDIPRVLLCLSLQTGISFEELQNYTEDELVLIIDSVRVPQEIIAGRKRLYVPWCDESGKQVGEIAGQEAEEFCQQFYASKEAFEGEILKGKTAHSSPSLVRGIVKCITRDYNDVKRMYRQMEEMKQGDILVTQTTDPEMMLALRKASAAITDIGGMLSHTAITARELNIPCIVDTKFATQRLRDGDEVEVDTEKGIVRILKRAQK